MSGYEPADLQLPDPPSGVHMVGIGGVGVSGLARMLARRGYVVTGSDLNDSPTVRELRAEGIPVAVGHDAANIGNADLVVVTAALRPDNPELVEAGRRGIPVVKRAACLGAAANPAICLAVAGRTANRTPRGWRRWRSPAGLGPSVAVGATVRRSAPTAAGSGRTSSSRRTSTTTRSSGCGRGGDRHQHRADHPISFPTRRSLAAFERSRRNSPRRNAGAVGGGRGQAASYGGDWPRRVRPSIVTFGDASGDRRLVWDGSSVAAAGPGGQGFEFAARVQVAHRLNALAVRAAAETGVVAGGVVAGLESFGGVSRRFEVLRDDDLTIVSDYAHHPTEVSATIAAARERYPGRRIVAVFQPHTYSRTRALLDDFAAALDAADVVVLAEIYRARETDTLGVASADVAARMRFPASVVGGAGDAARAVRALLRRGDVVLVMGAGDIYEAAEALAGADAPHD